MEPLKPELVARTLPIGAAGLAAVIAVVNFLPKLEELASKKIPASLKKPGDFQIKLERVGKAASYFQLSLISFSVSVFSSLVYIGLSEIYVRWIPPTLTAIGSYSGPIVSAIGTVLFSCAVFLWADYYLFLLKKPTVMREEGESKQPGKQA